MSSLVKIQDLTLLQFHLLFMIYCCRIIWFYFNEFLKPTLYRHYTVRVHLGVAGHILHKSAFSQFMLGFLSFCIDIGAILLVFSQKQGHSIAVVKQILYFCSWGIYPFHWCCFSSLKDLVPCVWGNPVYTCLFFKSSFVFVKGKKVSLFISFFFSFFIHLFCFTVKFQFPWILFKFYYSKINL